MEEIAIIGKGNVACHLHKALKGRAKLVDSRTLEGLPEGAKVIIICVSDNAIEEVVENVSAKITNQDCIIAHTSGSMDIDIFKDKSSRYGVFYPLQTFTKGAELNYEEIPVFIEGSEERVSEKLKEIAGYFSKDIREADSGQRRQLHLASVFACNFTNGMAGIAEELLAENGLDFRVLLPLMRQTVAKLEKLTPQDAQTGPAARGDTKVMEKHLEMLNGKEEWRQIYEEMSGIIARSASNGPSPVAQQGKIPGTGMKSKVKLKNYRL